MISDIISLLKFLIGLRPKPKPPIRIWLSEDCYECYFDIPSYDGNDYPRDGRLSYSFFKVTMKLSFPDRTVIDRVDAFLYKPGKEYLFEIHDPSELALYHSNGQEMGEAIQNFVDHNPPFQAITVDSNSPTKLVIPKYARLDPKEFHKSESPFYLTLVVHCGLQFLRLFCKLPLSGTTKPELNRHIQLRSEIERETLLKFATSAYRENKWGNTATIKG
jgi:hypothetical protein